MQIPPQLGNQWFLHCFALGVSGSARLTLHVNHGRTDSTPSALSPTSHRNKHLLQPRVTPRDQVSHGLESHTTAQQTTHAYHRHSPHLPAHQPRKGGAVGEAACANGWGSKGLGDCLGQVGMVAWGHRAEMKGTPARLLTSLESQTSAQGGRVSGGQLAAP